MAADLSTASAGVLTLRGIPRDGCLDLTRASVRLLLDDPEHRPAERLVLDGLEYDAIAAVKWRDHPPGYRLKWLRAGTQQIRGAAGGYKTVPFTPQPYRQLAAACRRAGDDRTARRILNRMYRDQNRRMTSRPWGKAWNWIQDLFLGYGYAPTRALITLLVLATGASFWFLHNDPAHVGIFEAGILSLGMVLPDTGLDKIEHWTQMSADARHDVRRREERGR